MFDEQEKFAPWKRFLMGSVVMVLIAATVATLAAFSQREDVAAAFEQNAIGNGLSQYLDGATGGPQTILLLGSDRRKADRKYGYPARSDTMMLVRLNPNKPVTTVMSFPRDLKVQIPGHGVGRINEAYAYGGPTLVVRTIEEATGIRANHVANVSFAGFRRGVDAIDCVYTDVDRKYFNSNTGAYVREQFATINIKAGYQKLCGTRALDYVRFRHYDSDVFRGARQQAFLRQAKQQVGVTGLFASAKDIKKIIAKNVRVDKGLANGANLQRFLTLAVKSAGKPVYQVEIPNLTTPTQGGVAYVEASNASLKKAARVFMKGPKQKGEVTTTPAATKDAAPKRKVKRVKTSKGLPKGTVYAKTEGRNQAVLAGFRIGLPVFYPTAKISGASYQDGSTRPYRMQTADGKRVSAYRIVAKMPNSNGDYYGIQGVYWDDPPILKNPSESRKVGGRTFDLYYEGGKLGLVAFKRDGASYWVSNTLSRKLNERQMMAIAKSLRLRKKGG
ncbi:MAG: LCP family protein [Solirubrobacterales bacterium]